MWHPCVSCSDDTPAREGPVVLPHFYLHFAVSMCAAAACTQETPYAACTEPPPPQPAMAPRLGTGDGAGGGSSRTIQSDHCLWEGPRRGTHACLRDGCRTADA